LGLFYATLYISTGVSSPYMAVWLKAGGLNGAEIGTILACPLLARVFTGPALAVWADRFQLRRTAILVMASGAAALLAAMLLVKGFWPWLTLWFAAATLFGACSPLTDVIVLKQAARGGFPYAFPRAIGSAGYVAGNVAGGALLAPLGPRIVVIWIAAASAPSGGPSPGSGLWGLLRDPVFMLMVGSVGLIQAAHAFYYTFSTLLWRTQGLSPSLIGLLWGVGVSAELAFLSLAEPWRKRLGPSRLLLLGGAAAVLRWTAFAFSPPVWLLFPLQLLHALSFTATFVASLSLVERLSDPESASTAQSLNAALYSGALIGLATLSCGLLYDHFGPFGYLAMSALAGVGLLGAIGLHARLERTA
jgi:PPP family 3-phenylpropionic acid transporter